jgi:hypothetical protein
VAECGHGIRFHLFHYWQTETDSDPENGYDSTWNRGTWNRGAWNRGKSLLTNSYDFKLQLNNDAKDQPEWPHHNTIRLDEQLAALLASNVSTGLCVRCLVYTDPLTRSIIVLTKSQQPIVEGSLVHHIRSNQDQLVASSGGQPPNRQLVESRNGFASSNPP